MRTFLPGIFLALISLTATAEPYYSSQGHLCSQGLDSNDDGTLDVSGAVELVAITTNSEHKEPLVATSFSEAKGMVYHWVANRETGTWSVIREMPTGLSCLTDAGTNWSKKGNTIVAILAPHSMLFRITITDGGEWLVSIQSDPESPVQIGVDGGSQWEWVGFKPAGFRI